MGYFKFVVVCYDAALSHVLLINVPLTSRTALATPTTKIPNTTKKYNQERI